MWLLRDKLFNNSSLENYWYHLFATCIYSLMCLWFFKEKYQVVRCSFQQLDKKFYICIFWFFSPPPAPLFRQHHYWMLSVCNFRYDGQRAQIHKLPNGTFRVFSRNGDETTSRFPDLINIMKESCKSAAVTFIVDAEVRFSYGRRCLWIGIRFCYLCCWCFWLPGGCNW